MKQILQSYKTGELRVADVPAPGVEPGAVLVLTTASLVSVGTERMTMDIAKKSLLGKARDRPDLVRKMIARASRDGVVATIEAARHKLDQPIPLGYSCAGRVVAVGDGVADLTVGARVACAGAKVANHAEVNLVPQNLCVPVPEGVPDEAAAFVTVGAIALQGVRLSVPTLGESFAVIGLGLLGQVAVQLLRANGCKVLGIDLDPSKVALARRLGAEAAVVRSDDVLGAARALGVGGGVDGVLITAATSSNDPIQLAGELCRDRGRVVIVGAVGMDIPRRPYYDKELSVFQSRSYGPGRYDPVYEEMGVDYPIGYVRWTLRRNMEAFLAQCAAGRVDTASLISHRFPIERAGEAYALIDGRAAAGGVPPLGVVLSYPALTIPARTVEVSPPVITPRRGTVRVGFIGAGAFAAGTLLPALAKIDRVHLGAIASARGFTARHLAEKYAIPSCTTDTDALMASDLDAVIIATRHDQHATLSARALRAGRHVFVEKPPALDAAQLDDVMAAQRESGRILTVGYNRRFAPLAVELAGLFAARTGPLVIHYRVNAGPLPADSWIYDPAVGGGRIVGEVCHFVDFCSFIAGAAPVEVMARAVAATGGVRPDENVTLSLSFADGSLATIAYVATGDPSAGKERVEVVGDGACGYLEDFRVLDLYRGGKPRFVRKLSRDKGHRAEVDTFIAAVRAGGPPPIDYTSLAATSRATFAALTSLATGLPVSVAR